MIVSVNFGTTFLTGIFLRPYQFGRWSARRTSPLTMTAVTERFLLFFLSRSLFSITLSSVSIVIEAVERYFHVRKEWKEISKLGIYYWCPLGSWRVHTVG